MVRSSQRLMVRSSQRQIEQLNKQYIWGESIPVRFAKYPSICVDVLSRIIRREKVDNFSLALWSVTDQSTYSMNYNRNRCLHYVKSLDRWFVNEIGANVLKHLISNCKMATPLELQHPQVLTGREFRILVKYDYQTLVAFMVTGTTYREETT